MFHPRATHGVTGVRTREFIARPARPAPVSAALNGRLVWQYDLTDAQYVSLSRLTATLCRVLPRIRPDVPRDARGAVRPGRLEDAELAAFSGVVGHYHVSNTKVDPGPALDWDRVLRRARRR